MTILYGYKDNDIIEFFETCCDELLINRKTGEKTYTFYNDKNIELYLINHKNGEPMILIKQRLVNDDDVVCGCSVLINRLFKIDKDDFELEHEFMTPYFKKILLESFNNVISETKNKLLKFKLEKELTEKTTTKGRTKI